jgi:alkyl hydroperoxide reductase subunit AhpC
MTMSLVEPGKKAPAFSLTDQDGKTHKLSDYAGQPVVVYFYPKDDTPGCTAEACAFRDNLPRFKRGKAAILGISILDEKSKAKLPASTTSIFRCSPMLITAWRRSTASGRRSRAMAESTWASRVRRT